MWKNRFEVNISYGNDRRWETIPRIREHSSNLEILPEEEEEEEEIHSIDNEQTNIPRYSYSNLLKHQCLLPTIIESLENEQHEDSSMEINTNYLEQYNEEIRQQKHPKRTKVRELLLRFTGLFKQ